MRDAVLALGLLNHPGFRDDYHRITDRGDAALLDVMDDIPGGDGIEFEPSRLDVHVGMAEFD